MAGHLQRRQQTRVKMRWPRPVEIVLEVHGHEGRNQVCLAQEAERCRMRGLASAHAWKK